MSKLKYVLEFVGAVAMGLDDVLGCGFYLWLAGAVVFAFVMAYVLNRVLFTG